MNKLVGMGGSGGIISVDPDGNISLTFNTPGMYRASVGTDGELHVGIYRDE
jgi:isoaspartyl peptidase/L-asparaginase-like protein (Ntn-hydrolase superfamily)